MQYMNLLVFVVGIGVDVEIVNVTVVAEKQTHYN